MEAMGEETRTVWMVDSEEGSELHALAYAAKAMLVLLPAKAVTGAFHLFLKEPANSHQ